MVETGVPGLEQTGWDALRGQLNTLDTSLLFLALLTGATALSWAILSRQRGALLSLLGQQIHNPAGTGEHALLPHQKAGGLQTVVHSVGVGQHQGIGIAEAPPGGPRPDTPGRPPAAAA